MAGEWRAARIEEIADRVAMGPFGSSIKVETFVPTGVPVISGQHLHGSKVDDRVGFNFVSPEHADRLKNANVRRGDVIFTHAGNIGQVAFVPETSQFERYVISQRQFYMRCDRAKVLPEFVVAYFKTPEGRHQLLANTSQVGVPSIAQPVTYLRTIEIPVPPLPEQRAIAHILGTLDDKIELNRRMNETLEAMARALFKSWFVDFDPVRARMNYPSPAGRGVGGEGTKPTSRPHAPIPTEFLDHARQLRLSATDAESLLWRLLRGRQIGGAKFRRQHAFPPYILDFYCHNLKLAVELDGGQHNEEAGRRRDRRRDEHLAEQGIRVLRFWNNEVLRETEPVLEAIYAAVAEQRQGAPSPPTPLPVGEGSFGLPQSLADLFPDSFEDSELGEIPKGWEVNTVGEHMVNFDSKRVPVSGAERVRRQGPYPYHGAAGVMDHVDHYLFDGIYLLVGEDGSVVQGTGLAVTQYVWGKIWVNNHAHVLEGTGAVSTEQLYLYFCFEPVAPYVTGAVQPKLSQGRMNTMPFVFAGVTTCCAFGQTVEPWFAKLRANVDETKTLSGLRDTLLPKLISGELRVKDAERFIEDATI